MSNVDPAGEWDDPDGAGDGSGDESAGTLASALGVALMGGGAAMSAYVSWALLTAGTAAEIVMGGVGVLVTLGLSLMALYFVVEVVT